MIPIADYDSHPAFRSNHMRTELTDDFKGINERVNALTTEFILSDFRHREIIDRSIGEWLDAASCDKELDQRLVEGLKNSIALAHEDIISDKLSRKAIGSIPATSSCVKEKYEKLYYEGYFSINMGSDKLLELKNLLNNDVGALRERSKMANGSIVFMEPSDPSAYKLLNEFCAESGVFDSLSTYFGRRYEKTGFVIHYSSPKDSWFHVFDDLGMAVSRTGQMHFDASFYHPKAMLYLNDVGKKNGAFGLIPRKSPIENLEFDLAFGKKIILEISKIAISDFGWIPGDNESGFRSPPAREVFMSLPHSLRRSSHAGDHILDHTALSKSLLAEEIWMEGEAGFMPVFVGSHTLHRGGMVDFGERVALQIIFYPNDPETANVHENRGKQAIEADVVTAKPSQDDLKVYGRGQGFLDRVKRGLGLRPRVSPSFSR